MSIPRSDRVREHAAEHRWGGAPISYPEAHVKFTEACAAHRTLQCPKNLAMAEMRLGRHAESAMHFREYVRSPEFTADPDAADIQKFFTEEQTKVGELRFVARDGAVVKLDEVPIGKAPFTDTWFVVPGKHDAAATYGDDKQTKTVDVPYGKVVDCDLSPPPAAIPTTTVPTAPSSTATIDPPTTTPPTYSRPAAGYAVPIALGVLGVAGIGLGIGEALSTQSKRDEANTILDACRPPVTSGCDRLRELRSSMSSGTTVSIVGYVMGGVLLAGGIVAFLLWPKSEDRKLVVVPVTGPSFAGIQANLKW